MGSASAICDRTCWEDADIFAAISATFRRIRGGYAVTAFPVSHRVPPA
mgnify:CR=1 FL=1